MEDTEVLTPAGPSRAPSHTSLHTIQPDIIIVGGGIAGCSLAYGLSSCGRKVLLLERDLSEPDRIVGELLQPGGVDALTELGLGGCLEGIDETPVEGYCVVSGERQVGIPYPDLERMIGEEAEWGEGKGKGKKKETDINGTSNGVANGVANGHAHGVSGEKSNGHSMRNIGTSPTWHVPSLSGRKEGRSFHHGRLIMSLRRACLGFGPELVVLEATVRDLVRCEHTGRVIGVAAAFKSAPPPACSAPSSTSISPSAASGDAAGVEAQISTVTSTVVRKVYAPITIIADGCFSKFRSTPGTRIPTPKTRSHFVGVVLKDAQLPLKRHGTVCLTPAGPVLLYQIGDRAEETRMLVDVKGKLPSVADGSLKNHIIERYLPHLPTALHDPILTALNDQRLRTMPNSFLPPSMQGLSSTPSGLIMVGDAWNMRHPLTGGGMTVAFNDAVLLTEYLGVARLGEGRDGLEDWDRVGEGLREWFWRRKSLAGVVNVLSMALYDLFGGADEPDLEILREGCFRYFELGGECIAGPVGLLSALTPKPLMLFYHFFSVAFYSIYILLTSGPPASLGEKKSGPPGWIELPGLLLFSFRVFWTACRVLLPMIATEFKV